MLFSCGINSATRSAISVCKSGGIVVGVGLNQFEMKLNMVDLLIREVD